MKTIGYKLSVSFFLVCLSIFELNANQLLSNGDYETQIIHYQQQSGYLARFNEGVSCYRLKRYTCAREAFSQAAWQASNDEQRGKAVFNLANTQFFLGSYKQASVLYKDAGYLGVASDKVQLNLLFSQRLYEAVRKKLADIEKTKSKADLRANAKVLPEDFNDRLTDGLYFSQTDTDEFSFNTFTSDQVNQLVSRGVKHFNKLLNGNLTDDRYQWLKSSSDLDAGDTISILNRVMLMELGLPANTTKPYRIDGHRAW